MATNLTIWMPHIIEEILKNLTYQQIFEKREVDSTWHSICTRLINKGCLRMKEKFESCFTYLDKIHSECQFYDENRFDTYYYQHLLDLTRNDLELIQAEFNLTLACVERYFSNYENVCLFDSSLLDLTAWLILRIHKFPWHDLGSDLSITDPPLFDGYNIEDYRSMSKRCQLRFNYHVERHMNTDWTVSGAKVVDILDALIDRPSHPVKTIHCQEYSTDTKLIRYKATYTLENAWLHRDPTTETDEYSFNSFFYFLYIRLIRLVRYHNRFTLEAIHQRRTGCSEFCDGDRSPPGFKFSGRGRNDGHVYNYACCNDKMKTLRYEDIGERRLELVVTLVSSYVSSSVELRKFVRANFRQLDFETKSLQLKLEVLNHSSSASQAASTVRWQIEIP